MNLFLLLSQLGLSYEHSGHLLVPIGTVYDPFVCRGLDALIYALYNGARFVIAGTPSGISLSREGGAHQSTITPSIGLELPGLTYTEPTYPAEVDWLLRYHVDRLLMPEPTPRACTCGSRRSRSTRRRSTRCARRAATRPCEPTCSRAATGSPSPPRASSRRSASWRAARSCPRRSRRATCCSSRTRSGRA